MSEPKITLVEITSHGCPRLWEVLIDGKRTPSQKYGPSTCAVRVLKMGARYLPVNDNVYVYPFGFDTKKEAARVAARVGL